MPVAGPDELGFPDVLLMDFDEVVAFDNRRHSLHVICEVRCDEGDDPRALYAAAVERIRRAPPRAGAAARRSPAARTAPGRR